MNSYNTFLFLTGISIVILSIARNLLNRSSKATVLNANQPKVLVAPDRGNIRHAPGAHVLVQSDKKMLVVGPHPIYNNQTGRTYNVINDKTYNVMNDRTYNAISRRSLLGKLRVLKVTAFGIGIFMIMLVRNFLVGALGVAILRSFYL